MIVCNSSQAEHYRLETYKCRNSVLYFLDRYGQIYDATARAWVPFHLWPKQIEALQTLAAQRLTIILKARQLGLTWLTLGWALWQMLFHPAATILLFSRRDDEAVDLLKNRLRGLYDRLPGWLKVRAFAVNNDHEWQLSNDSRVLALPTTAGDSYSATLAVVDEADLVPDLDRLLRSVKPTIDAGGRLVLLSRADKTRPNSTFKRMYMAAKQGHTEWVPLFLPWDARPDRDPQWYEAQKADILHRTGSLDDLREQYPASDHEALAPRTLDKRLAPAWLEQCYQELPPLAQLPPRPRPFRGSGFMPCRVPIGGTSWAPTRPRAIPPVTIVPWPSWTSIPGKKWPRWPASSNHPPSPPTWTRSAAGTTPPPSCVSGTIMVMPCSWP
jgi:hypothetical protein